MGLVLFEGVREMKKYFFPVLHPPSFLDSEAVLQHVKQIIIILLALLKTFFSLDYLSSQMIQKLQLSISFNCFDWYYIAKATTLAR